MPAHSLSIDSNARVTKPPAAAPDISFSFQTTCSTTIHSTCKSINQNEANYARVKLGSKEIRPRSHIRNELYIQKMRQREIKILQIKLPVFVPFTCILMRMRNDRERCSESAEDNQRSEKGANAETKLDLEMCFLSLCLILHSSTGLPSTELSPCQFATAGSDFQISLHN